MNSRIRTLLGAAALALPFALASCADSGTSAPDSQMTTAQIMAEDSARNPECRRVPPGDLRDTLNLSDEQVAQIKAIQDSLRQLAKAEIDAANGDRAQIRAILEKYRLALKEAVNGVLTAEQIAILEALKAPFPGQGRGRGHGLGGGRENGGPAEREAEMLKRMADDLGLSQDQIDAIKALQESIRTNRPEDPRAAFRDGLATILTAEQLAKFDEHAPKDGDGGRPPHGPRRR